MEIEYAQLKKSLDELKLEIPDFVQYRGRTYLIFLNPENNPPAWWSQSTEFNGADIYVYEGIRKEFQRLVIMHEVIEADLILHQRVHHKKAHILASENDLRYASETLDSKTLVEYRQFKQESEEFLGGL